MIMRIKGTLHKCNNQRRIKLNSYKNNRRIIKIKVCLDKTIKVTPNNKIKMVNSNNRKNSMTNLNKNKDKMKKMISN